MDVWIVCACVHACGGAALNNYNFDQYFHRPTVLLPSMCSVHECVHVCVCVCGVCVCACVHACICMCVMVTHTRIQLPTILHSGTPSNHIHLVAIHVARKVAGSVFHPISE